MITQDEAIEIARKHAKLKGWAFAEPLHITETRNRRLGITRFDIETNAGRLGTKARFTIDAQTGEIISEGYISR